MLIRDLKDSFQKSNSVAVLLSITKLNEYLKAKNLYSDFKTKRKNDFTPYLCVEKSTG